MTFFPLGTKGLFSNIAPRAQKLEITASDCYIIIPFLYIILVFSQTKPQRFLSKNLVRMTTWLWNSLSVAMKLDHRPWRIQSSEISSTGKLRFPMKQWTLMSEYYCFYKNVKLHTTWEYLSRHQRNLWNWLAKGWQALVCFFFNSFIEVLCTWYLNIIHVFDMDNNMSKVFSL